MSWPSTVPRNLSYSRVLFRIVAQETICLAAAVYSHGHHSAVDAVEGFGEAVLVHIPETFGQRLLRLEYVVELEGVLLHVGLLVQILDCQLAVRLAGQHLDRIFDILDSDTTQDVLVGVLLHRRF